MVLLPFSKHFLRQESLVAMQGLDNGSLEELMDDVVAIVSFIRGLSLVEHRQFRLLLEGFETQHDLLYHSYVRWLSKCKFLERLWHPYDLIVAFLSG